MLLHRIAPLCLLLLVASVQGQTFNTTLDDDGLAASNLDGIFLSNNETYIYEEEETVAPTAAESTTTNSTSAEEESEPTVTSWSGIYMTALVSLIQGAVFYAFFLYQRGAEKKKDSMDLYEPRQYTRKNRSPAPFASNWWKADLKVEERDLLRCVGLDSFMFLRFLRLGARLCAVGTFWAFLLVPIYATGDNRGNDTEQFNQLTLARVEPGSNRLWASLLAWVWFVGCILWFFWTEWQLYSVNRSAFLARGDVDMQPEYRYAVRVEQIPKKYRTDGELYKYFDRLFPNQVQQASVFWETPHLSQLMQERQQTIELLEKAVAVVHAKPEQPRPRIRPNKGICGGGDPEVDAVEYYQGEIKRLNAEIDQERATVSDTIAKATHQEKQEKSSWTKLSTNFFSSVVKTSQQTSTDNNNSTTPEERKSDAAASYEKVQSDESATEITLDKGKSAAPFEEPSWMEDGDDDKDKDVPAKVTSTAHVTFISLRSKQAAIQCELTGNPDSMVVVAAPDPKAVLWQNVAVPLPQQKIFQWQAAGIFTAGILFWAVPVSFVTAIANLNGILQAFGLPTADPTAAWYGLVSGLLPVIFLAILMAVLYMAIVAAATHLVRYKSSAEVDAYSLYWHQLFQFANLWLILIGGSAFDQIDGIMEDPTAIIDIIATALPASSVFFVNMMLVGSFGAWGMELSLLPAYGVSLVMKLIQPEAMLTQRQLDQAKTPPSIVWGKQVPPVVFIFLVVVVYMPIVPLMEVFGLIYFSGYYLVFKHQCLHVYAQEFEGGGEATWQKLFPFLMACLYMGELIFIAYMGIMEGPIQAGLGFVPFILTILFHIHLNRTVVRPLENLSLEVAADVDIDDGELDPTGASVLYGMPALKTEEEEREPLPYRREEGDEEVANDDGKVSSGGEGAEVTDDGTAEEEKEKTAASF